MWFNSVSFTVSFLRFDDIGMNTILIFLIFISQMFSQFWNVFDPHVDVIYVSLVILKGLSYALNNPAKETLYTITNVDVKYKVNQN